MCSNAKTTYKNRQKMISKTCTERTSENSLYHKRNEKIYKNRISFYQSYGNSPKSCRNLKKVYSRTKQESRVSVRRISFVDFNLPYYHFSLPSSSTVALKMNSQKGAQQRWSPSKLHSQRTVSIPPVWWFPGRSHLQSWFVVLFCLKPDMELAQHEKTFFLGTYIQKQK